MKTRSVSGSERGGSPRFRVVLSRIRISATGTPLAAEPAPDRVNQRRSITDLASYQQVRNLMTRYHAVGEA